MLSDIALRFFVQSAQKDTVGFDIAGFSLVVIKLHNSLITSKLSQFNPRLRLGMEVKPCGGF